MLRHGPRSVQDLQQALALDQSIVSQHLARLRGGGRAPGRPSLRRDPRALRSLARHPPGRRRLVQRLRAGDRWSHRPALRPRALRSALRRLAAPRRLPPGDRARHAQHGGGAAPHLLRHAGSENRDRGRRLRGRRRHLPWLVRRHRRRARDRAGRRADPPLPALAGRAARGPPRRAGTPALMPALVYALTALLGAAAAATGVAGMLGAAWALRIDWLVPLGGMALAMDPPAEVFIRARRPPP